MGRKAKKGTVYLIEWQTKSGWTEYGEDTWEVDHNAGIWFTERGALKHMNERLREFGETYNMRVSRYKRE